VCSGSGPIDAILARPCDTDRWSLALSWASSAHAAKSVGGKVIEALVLPNSQEIPAAVFSRLGRQKNAGPSVSAPVCRRQEG